ARPRRGAPARGGGRPPAQDAQAGRQRGDPQGFGAWRLEAAAAAVSGAAPCDHAAARHRRGRTQCADRRARGRGGPREGGAHAVIVPDVNLLLYAEIDAFEQHAAARRWWEDALAGELQIGLASVVLFGFL